MLLRRKAALAAAEANLLAAQAQRDAAQLAVDRTVLAVPFDGTIATINNDVGETVGGGVPLMLVSDNSEWMVETTDLTELQIVDVEVGKTATIRFDALPESSIESEVIRISPQSSLNRGDVTYRVVLSIPNGLDALPVRSGMTAFVEIDK